MLGPYRLPYSCLYYREQNWPVRLLRVGNRPAAVHLQIAERDDVFGKLAFITDLLISLRFHSPSMVRNAVEFIVVRFRLLNYGIRPIPYFFL